MNYLDEKERKDRRERIATGVLQGLLAGKSPRVPVGKIIAGLPDIARVSLRITDALISELDKEEDSTEGR